MKKEIDSTREILWEFFKSKGFFSGLTFYLTVLFVLPVKGQDKFFYRTFKSIQKKECDGKEVS